MEFSVRNHLCLWEAVTPSTITASRGSKTLIAVKENCKKLVGLGSVFFPKEWDKTVLFFVTVFFFYSNSGAVSFP